MRRTISNTIPIRTSHIVDVRFITGPVLYPWRGNGFSRGYQNKSDVRPN
jgi:hypothetical protein